MNRPLLLPLVPAYAAALWAKRRFVEERPGYARRLEWPVISVGSVSVGGAGKTPVVAALAELLERHGFAADVLSRGYGRRSAAAERVDAGGTAERFGDEPLMLARAGLAVYVGADRYAAGQLAELSAGAGCEWRVHLLDDGFQHRRLARVLDVVLLTAEETRDCLLPAGNLREPLTRLRNAGAVVLREEEADALRPKAWRIAGEMPVWVTRRRLVLAPTSVSVVVFCGIARPEGFFAMLRSAGVEWAGKVVFRDHHQYETKDVERLAAEAKRVGAKGFVTTEKDAVKLTAEMRERLEPLIVAGLRVEFSEEEAVIEQMRTVLPIGA